MRLSKIYTKVGDRGETMLASGAFVPKVSSRIEAYGTVDELNATMGLLCESLKAWIEGLHENRKKLTLGQDVINRCLRIQNELFDLGAELATPNEVLNLERQIVLGKDDITRLENEMDEMNERLAPLANFVLPGGSVENAYSHLARTVCRRAEREVLRLASSESVRSEALIYLNRLSDWLFLVGRYVLVLQDKPETLWNQRKPQVK